MPILLTSYFSGRQLESTLKVEVSNFLNYSNTEISGDIDHQLEELTLFATIVAHLPQVVEFSIKANQKNQQIGEKSLMAETLAIDKDWIKNKTTNKKSIEIANNSVSVLFRAIRDQNPNRFGEIFLTDAKGRNLAMTSPLTDYYQADEAWWQSRRAVL